MSRSLSPDAAAGVFETLLVVGGSPVELDAHLQRLGRSTSELYGAAAPGSARELVLERSRSLRLGRLRLTVAPAAGGGLAADVATAEVEPAAVFPSWDRAVELRQFVVEGGLGAHKWADRAALAALESELPEGCLPLLLDAGGEVLEGSRANVFAVEGEVLITPSADGRILPGIARSRAIEAARSLGLEVREQQLSLERLIATAEAFLTGSVRGVEPVRAVEGAGLRRPGEVVREIAAAMKRRWIASGTA